MKACWLARLFHVYALSHLLVAIPNEKGLSVVAGANCPAPEWETTRIEIINATGVAFILPFLTGRDNISSNATSLRLCSTLFETPLSWRATLVGRATVHQ
ncbi:uncharacterized protein F4817DRAFT_342713, partial [Daldinia loculata]|uniref:uncharacterized protein n=1 Tax=Daldinia loculata TaxID=103429 RepID=UPI0020C2A005